MILDTRNVRTIRKQTFGDFKSLRTINVNNAHIKTPDSLNTMKSITERYHIDSDKTEMFLFEFGLNLKLFDTSQLPNFRIGKRKE